MADITVTIGEKEKKDKITITVGKKEEDGAPRLTFELNARKTLEGDIVIRDHPDIDVVVMPKKMKVVAFPKEASTEETYQTQDKLFDYLTQRGVITRDSIQGGNVFGAMQAKIPMTEKNNSSKFVLLGIAKWLAEEKPYFDYLEKFEQIEEDRFTEPTEEESTDFDPSRHSEKKGILRPMYIRSPYGLNFAYGYRE
tara:strand:- start:444 stop:1031 length:588 start_codon:yes stop_codon:yes gene_type:complete